MLAVRLDNLGDVLVTGPAVRALAAGSRSVTVLAGPQGAAAAHLLPGVDEVIVYDAPWVSPDPAALDPARLRELERQLAQRAFDEAVIFTSFHQTPLPAALLLRTAGVPRISAISTDYPGALLDVRHLVDEDIPESERALSVATAAGFPPPPGDGGRLAVRGPLPAVDALTPSQPYVVAHPGCSAPARSWPANRWSETVEALTASGHAVVVTGAPSERGLTAQAAGTTGIDIGGRTDLRQLAAVLAGAGVLIAPNTGPAHLAAAVGTPVVSLFAPVVPLSRWSPYGVPCVVLGDQHAPCAGTRARTCPVPGHPCLSEISARDVVSAVRSLLIETGREALV